MRRLSIVLAFSASLLSWSLPAAAGQAGLPRPRVELGLDASASASEGTHRAVSGRVTVNLTPDTSLVTVADVYAAKAPYGARPGWQDTRLLLVELRRAVEQSKRLTVSLIAGGGAAATRRFFPALTLQSGNTTISYPESMYKETGVAVSFGAGFEEQLTSRLSLHQDIRYVFAEEGAQLRAQFGMGLPFGKYSAGPVSESYFFGGEPLRTGHAIWIARADGTTAQGRLVAIDATNIEIVTANGRTLVRTDDVVRIDRPDTLGNGAKIGAIIGAVAGAVFVGSVAYALCEEGCSSEALAVVLVGGLGAGMGAGIGALTGALADSLHAGRRTIFERQTDRTTLSIAPVLSAHARGARATLSW